MLSKAAKKRQKKLVKEVEARFPLIKPPIEGLLFQRTEACFDEINHTFFVEAKSEKKALSNIGQYYPVEGLHFHSAYDCTGKPFCDPAAIREVMPGRFLVHLDIKYDV